LQTFKLRTNINTAIHALLFYAEFNPIHPSSKRETERGIMSQGGGGIGGNILPYLSKGREEEDEGEMG
jgi:hypothetical protein